MVMADLNQLHELNEERSENDLDYKAVSYNPNKSLSIDHQRVRLPIYNYKEQIIYLLEKYQVLVIVGETGCGKSTQLPQFLLEYGFADSSDGNSHGRMIGVTEPRRIAAITLAARVAEEMSVQLGNQVGYSIRFEEFYDKQETKIKFMTEGILLREMMNDPLLTEYGAIVVDEVHERSVNTDILLSLLKKIIRKRPDLKLLISSATMDSGSICDYFNTLNGQSVERATCLFVEGRAYPVDIFHLDNPTANYVKESVATVIKIHEHFPHGDILVFLTGQEEVEEVVSQLFDYARNHKDDLTIGKKLFVLPLYASLPSSDQLKVFQTFPKSVRKVIVATNIAEASVTINGISFVVDSGFVKTRYFNFNTGTDSLVIVPVSKASAQQRAGRAGRNRHGYAFRLYPEKQFEALANFTAPEIQRVALPSVILQLKALGINNIIKFDLLCRPPDTHIISALDVLYALQAIDQDGALTDPLGLQMAEFPLSPAFSKILLCSQEFNCSEEILTIASVLQVQNLFLMPSSGQRAIQARRAKHNLSVEEGDAITYLNIYNQFLKAAKIRSWADKNYLNYKGLLRAHEIRNRLSSLLRKFKVRLVSSSDVESIIKCIVSGFFNNAAQLGEDGVYRTIRGNHELHIHPTSVLYTLKRPPKFVVFTEVIHTTKEYMKDVTAIKPEWLYQIAPHYYEFGTEREILERKQV